MFKPCIGCDTLIVEYCRGSNGQLPHHNILYGHLPKGLYCPVCRAKAMIKNTRGFHRSYKEMGTYEYCTECPSYVKCLTYKIVEDSDGESP